MEVSLLVNVGEVVFTPTKVSWVLTSCFLLDLCTSAVCRLEANEKRVATKRPVVASSCFLHCTNCVGPGPRLGSSHLSLCASFNTDLETSAQEWLKMV